jgi:hypothetical protein
VLARPFWQPPSGNSALGAAATLDKMRLLAVAKMRALGVALIVIGFAFVCGGLIFRRRLEPDEESSQAGSGEIPQSLDPIERSLLEDLRRLNAMEPQMRNERSEDS